MAYPLHACHRIFTKVQFLFRGDRLRKARQEKGLSQKELAGEVGTERHAIGRYEAGTPPDVGTLWKLADRLGISAGYLVGHRDGPDRAEWLTADEREMLTRFRALDERGRQQVLEALSEALSLMKRLRGR